MNRAPAGSVPWQAAEMGAPQGVELRHLRYFVAVADACTFTHAAEQMFIAQPTLSQQIRRLEQMVGTPLLQRRREGVRLTKAGSVLLEESRTVLSLLDHGMSRTRQAAGLGRPYLRFVMPSDLPEALAVAVASRLRRTAAAADVDVAWMETTTLDGEFSPVLQRRADAGLGWLTAGEAGPACLEVMSLGEFEPDVWLPPAHPAPGRVIGLGELAGMEVIHGPRRLSAAAYDAWLAVMRASNPRFGFTDPPLRRSLPMTLAFAATASRPTAVLTGPHHRIGNWPGPAEPDPAGGTGMVRARIEGSPLTAKAGLAWSGDLPRPLQQVLFDTADSITFCSPPSAAGQHQARHRLQSGPLPAPRPAGQFTARAEFRIHPHDRQADRQDPGSALGRRASAVIIWRSRRPSSSAKSGCPIQAHIASIPQMIIVPNCGAEWLICTHTQAQSYLRGLANIRRSGVWSHYSPVITFSLLTALRV
jgi:DNA-binding transcriptional LysR family regulator